MSLLLCEASRHPCLLPGNQSSVTHGISFLPIIALRSFGVWVLESTQSPLLDRSISVCLFASLSAWDKQLDTFIPSTPEWANGLRCTCLDGALGEAQLQGSSVPTARDTRRLPGAPALSPQMKYVKQESPSRNTWPCCAFLATPAPQNQYLSQYSMLNILTTI